MPRRMTTEDPGYLAEGLEDLEEFASGTTTGGGEPAENNPFREFSPGELCSRLRTTMDQIESLNTQLSTLSAERQNLESCLKSKAKELGLDSFRGPGMTVTIVSEPIAELPPDKWDEVHRWLVEHDYGFCIQRRLTNKRVVELFDAGVALPSGITLRDVTRVKPRRLPINP